MIIGTKMVEQDVYLSVCLDENGVPHDTDGNQITDTETLAALGK